MSQEPSVMVSNSVARLSKNRNIPVMKVNSTNKIYKIKKGCVIAKLEKIEDAVSEVVKQGKENELEIFDEIDAPDKYANQIKDLLRKNADLFATKDSDLSHNDTTRMKINTGEPLANQIRAI